MRSSFAVRTGLLRLAKTPSHREITRRRTFVVVGALLAVAVGAGVIGALAGPGNDVRPAALTGPFSYFPTE